MRFDAESIALVCIALGMLLWLAHHETGYSPLIYAAFLAVVIAVAAVAAHAVITRAGRSEPPR